LCFGKACQKGRTIANLADDLQMGKLLQCLAESSAHDGVIICQQNTHVVHIYIIASLAAAAYSYGA
jgi:hypothetical protein